MLENVIVFCVFVSDMAGKEDLEPLLRYRYRVKNDPLRLSILAAHALIEEMIEIVIAEGVPNSDCFDVPNIRFWQKFKIIRALAPWPEDSVTAMLWKCIEKLTNLRNAAAHRNYESLRNKLFADLAESFYPDPESRSARDHETLLQESTELCAGLLLGMQETFRKRREDASL